MKPILIPFAFMLAMAVVASPGYSQDTSAVAVGDLSYQVEDISGTITRIEPARRIVKVRTRDNREISLKAPAPVDLSEFQKGDKITAEYIEAVAIQMRKATEQESRAPLQVVDSVRVSRAGIEELQQVMALVQVTRVDRNRGYVEFKDPSGDKHRVKINDQAFLQTLNTGDKLVISYTPATAATMRKAE